MFRTTDTFLNIFSQVLVFLPLIPVVLILWKRFYRIDSLNFLMILCLVEFIEQLSLHIDAFPTEAAPGISNLFLLLESVIYFLLFRSHFGGMAREVLLYFAIAFFSSLITYYIVAGINQEGLSMHLIQFALIACMVSYCMAGLIKRDNPRILQFPIFWIGAGTLFYILILAITVITEKFLHKEYGRHGAGQGIQKMIIVDMADLARYAFYIIAVWVRNMSERSESKHED
ncbi:MAG: hypothetical protein ACHQET_14245 [Chitinophagales bacterium]